MYISDKHLFLTASSEMKELIKPLTPYGIDYFTYNKNYIDGTRIRLTTHANHLKAFLENECYKTGNIDASPDLYLEQAALFSTLKNQELVSWIRNDFAVHHGIYIVRKSEHYTEFFSFATSVDNPMIINFYLNNLDFLQRFCDHFKEIGSGLTMLAEQQKLIHDYHKQEGIQQCQAYQKANLWPKTFIDKPVSIRKKEVISLLLKGLRTKEIAKILAISPRTVEEHIADLKHHFKANNIIELVSKLGKCF